MIHLRIVAPQDTAKKALDLLRAEGSVCNVIHLPGVAQKPDGDVILADVAREDASVVIDDLRELRIPEQGSITLDSIDTQLSEGARRAEEHAPGLPSDAVVWEEVESRTEEDTELSASFVIFMVLACLIAAAGILTDQPILIVGAMVVGPEFGPLAGLSVALVETRAELARRSLVALAIGFPAGIVLAALATLAFKGLGVIPQEFDPRDHPATAFISEPGFFSFFVAYVGGTAGVLSLTSTKSGVLIGVLISVTTIPSAANIGVSVAYGDAAGAAGAAAQLAINLAAIVLAGVVTLFLQRRLYVERRREHLRDPVRTEADLPLGRSRRARAADERP
ncbi:MAG: DUF389 domain-containing protein [Actinomycetota bacterium]|nr:DUF389 domain-containing protein [Actinomycetota bacterium]MDQ3719485.1 DUF389 domain-containing protein [Actinomycetota bacterium]